MDYDKLPYKPVTENDGEVSSEFKVRSKQKRFWSQQEEDYFFEIWGRENWRLTRHGKNSIYFAQWAEEVNNRFSINIKPEEIQAKVNQTRAKFRLVKKQLESENGVVRWKRFSLVDKILKNQYCLNNEEPLPLQSTTNKKICKRKLLVPPSKTIKQEDNADLIDEDLLAEQIMEHNETKRVDLRSGFYNPSSRPLSDNIKEKVNTKCEEYSENYSNNCELECEDTTLEEPDIKPLQTHEEQEKQQMAILHPVRNGQNLPYIIYADLQNHKKQEPLHSPKILDIKPQLRPILPKSEHQTHSQVKESHMLQIQSPRLQIIQKNLQQQRNSLQKQNQKSFAQLPQQQQYESLDPQQINRDCSSNVCDDESVSNNSSAHESQSNPPVNQNDLKNNQSQRIKPILTVPSRRIQSKSSSLELEFIQEMRKKNIILEQQNEISQKRLKLEERKIELMEDFFPKCLILQQKIYQKLNT